MFPIICELSCNIILEARKHFKAMLLAKVDAKVCSNVDIYYQLVYNTDKELPVVKLSTWPALKWASHL